MSFKKLYTNPIELTTTHDMTTDFIDEGLQAFPLSDVAFLVSWSSFANAGTSSFSIDVTNDDLENVNDTPTWVALTFFAAGSTTPVTTIDVSGASGSHVISVLKCPAKWIRINYTANGATDGLLKISAISKGF